MRGVTTVVNNREGIAIFRCPVRGRGVWQFLRNNVPKVNML